MTDITDIGPLDWRIGIVDKTGRPTPEFQRRWNSQRNNNALIGTLTFGNGVPPNTPVPEDGAEYLDITNVPAILYVGKDEAWLQVGPINFTDLLDVPHSYTGHGSQLVRVNSGESGLEFATLSSAIDLGFGSTEGNLLVRGSSGWESLGAGTATDVLTSNGPGTVPSWQAGGGGGGGSRGLFDLGTMPAMSGFTQIGVSGSVSVTESAGKAFSITNTSPPTDSGIFTSGFAIAVPTPPYRVAIFVLTDSIVNNYANVFAGWRDSGSGKIEGVSSLLSVTAGAPYGTFEHEQWNSNTSRSSANTFGASPSILSPGMWYGLHDDNSGNVIFEFSTTGGVFTPIITVSKSSGFLGSSGYNEIYFGAMWDDNVIGGRQQSNSFLAYDPSGLTRVVG